MCHGLFYLLEPVNPVFPGEGRWPTGDAYARASGETGVQLDPMQARFDELLRRMESQESLIRTLQATQIPLNEEQPESDWWTAEATEPQRRPDDDAWWNGYDQWTGQGWSQGWNNWSNASWSNTKPTNNPTTVPTWNGDAKLFDDYEFDVLMHKSVSNPGDYCFLIPRLISGLTARARDHLGMAGDIDRFAVDGGLEQFLEFLKTKMGIRRPQEEGMAFKRYIYEIKRARGESMTSWINRSDEPLMGMRKKLATAPGAISSESTMIPPQIQGWLLLHRARLRYQDIVGVMTMTGGRLNIQLAEKPLLDLFTDDVLQSVDRSHGKDSGNTRKQYAPEAIEEIPEDDDDTYLDDDFSDKDGPHIDEDGNFFLRTKKSCLTLTMTWPLMMRSTMKHSLAIVRHETS